MSLLKHCRKRLAVPTTLEKICRCWIHFFAPILILLSYSCCNRFPTRVLLEENGIEAVGNLSTFPDIGEPLAIANLMNSRREKDKPGVSNTIIDKDSVRVSGDGKVLTFKLKTEIEVQKPELLMEQYGVSKLFRVTVAKATLESSDGNILAAFASALETDFNGDDGVSLQASVDSFKATEREFGF